MNKRSSSDNREGSVDTEASACQIPEVAVGVTKHPHAGGKGGVICCSCNQLIRGQVIQALNKTWHPDHFICNYCKRPIKDGRFNVHEDKPYCETDYSQLFLKRCKGCNLPIRDVVIVALNSNWHKEHFLCALCGTKLCNKGYFEKDDNAFCKSCWEERYCPRCKACEESITDVAILAMGDKWHQTCFVCMICSKPIVTTKFQVVNEKPMCDLCYQQYVKDHE